MKYVVAIVVTMSALNAFIMWCALVAASREDRQMEKMMRRMKDERDKSGTEDNED